MRFAPQPHLRRLWNFRRYRQCQDFGKRGTWIYALFSSSSKRVYVGQIGALGLPKAGVTRFRQHIRACNSYTTLYGHKHCRDLGSIYPMMARTGFEHWGMILLEHCPPNRALRMERAWGRRLTPTLNVRDVPVYSRRWELLLRGKLAEIPQQRRSLNSSVQSILHNLPSNNPPCCPSCPAVTCPSVLLPGNFQSCVSKGPMPAAPEHWAQNPTAYAHNNPYPASY